MANMSWNRIWLCIERFEFWSSNIQRGEEYGSGGVRGGVVLVDGDGTGVDAYPVGGGVSVIAECGKEDQDYGKHCAVVVVVVSRVDVGSRVSCLVVEWMD
jgi:hypothetical protein